MLKSAFEEVLTIEASPVLLLLDAAPEPEPVPISHAAAAIYSTFWIIAGIIFYFFCAVLTASAVAGIAATHRDIGLPMQRFISDISSPSLIQPVDFDEIHDYRFDNPVDLDGMDGYRFDDRSGHGESPLIRSVFWSEASFCGVPLSHSRSIDAQPGSLHYRPLLLGLVSYLNEPNINKRLIWQPGLEILGLWKADRRSSWRTSISTKDSMRTNMSRTFKALIQPTDFMNEQIGSTLMTSWMSKLAVFLHKYRRDE